MNDGVKNRLIFFGRKFLQMVVVLILLSFAVFIIARL